MTTAEPTINGGLTDTDLQFLLNQRDLAWAEMGELESVDQMDDRYREADRSLRERFDSATQSILVELKRRETPVILGEVTLHLNRWKDGFLVLSTDEDVYAWKPTQVA